MYTGKLVLTNKQRTPFALSNNFDDTFGLVDSIKECHSAEELCKIANKYHDFNYAWTIDKDSTTDTRLKHTDVLGNVKYLIAYKKPETKRLNRTLSAMEVELMDGMIWRYLIKSLEDNVNKKHGFWTDGEEILCKTEEQAEAVANFLEDLGFECLTTGFYDPEENKRDNCVDDHTGYWYINNN